MSNRNEADITFAAELKAAHLAQIEALTAPGLTRVERVNRFMDAARFDGTARKSMREMLGHVLGCSCLHCQNISAARLCWSEGGAPYSLFAELPGCHCPVMEVMSGRKIDGIPGTILSDWAPTADDLLPFARVQQERRL